MAFVEFNGKLDDEPTGYVEFNGELDSSAQRDLPEGVRPGVYADAGRGNPVDPRRTDAPEPEQPDQEVVTSARAWQGAGAGRGNASDPRRLDRPGTSGSVLEGVRMDDQPFDAAEAGRESRRDYAESKDRLLNAPADAPSMTAATEPLIPVREDGVFGRAADLVGAQIDSYVAGGAAKVADFLLGPIGAEAAQADLRGRAAFLGERSGRAERSVSANADTAVNKYVPQILAVFPTMAVAAVSGGLPVFFGIAEVQAYGEGRRAGLSPTDALMRAVPVGAAEVIGEKLGGTGKLISSLEKVYAKGATREAMTDLGGLFVKAGAKEIPSEEATYAMQFGIDKMPGIGLRQDATAEDFLAGAKETAIVAAGAGSGMAAGGAGISAGSKAYWTPERQIAAAIQQSVDGTTSNQTVVDDIVRASLDPNQGQMAPAPPAAPIQTEREKLESLRATVNDEKVAATTAILTPTVESAGSMTAAVDQAIGAAQAATEAGTADQIITTRINAIDTQGLLEWANQQAPEQPAQTEAPAQPVATQPAAQIEQPAIQTGAVTEPEVTWFGRRGDGYETEVKARAGLANVSKKHPDLTFKVEPMPSGRFRVAGYPTQTNAPQATTQPAGVQATAQVAAPETAIPTAIIEQGSQQPAAPVLPTRPVQQPALTAQTVQQPALTAQTVQQPAAPTPTAQPASPALTTQPAIDPRLIPVSERRIEDPYGVVSDKPPTVKELRDDYNAVKNLAAAIEATAPGLGDKVRAVGPVSVSDEQAGVSGQVLREARTVGRITNAVFGVKPVLVRGIPGYGVAHGGKVFVNVDEISTAEGGDSISGQLIGHVGHEATHAAFQQSNDPADIAAYTKFVAVVDQYLRPGVVAQRQQMEDRVAVAEGGKPRGAAYAKSEVVADINAGMWRQPEFWARLFDIDNGSTMRRVAYKFMEAAAKVVSYMKSQRLDPSKFVSDVIAVREAAAQMWADKARRVDYKGPKKQTMLGPLFSRNDAGVVAEVAPNPDAPAAKEWREMTPAERETTTAAVVNKTVPRVLDSLGLKGWTHKLSTGRFEGEVNPNVLIAAGDDATPEQMDEVARAVGYVLDQKSVVVFDESIKTGDAQESFVKIVLPDGMSTDQVNSLREAIAKKFPAADGDTVRDGALIFGNFTRFGDNEISDDEFYEGIVGAVESFAWTGDKIRVLEPNRFYSVLIWPDSRDAYLEGTRYGGSDSQQVQAGGDDVRGQRRSGFVQLQALAEEAIGLRDRWIGARGAARPSPRSGEAGKPERDYGEPRDGAVAAVGVHFSAERRPTLDSAYFGTGLRGAERERLSDPANADIRPRINFYVDSGNGVRPEAGVGGVKHVVRLKNLYPVKADPLGIVKNLKGASEAARATAFERAVVKAGFDGFLRDNAGGQQDYAVVIGKHEIEMPRYSRFVDSPDSITSLGAFNLDSNDKDANADKPDLADIGDELRSAGFGVKGAPPSRAVDIGDVKPADIKTAGLLAESAFPMPSWREDSSGNLTASVRYGDGTVGTMTMEPYGDAADDRWKAKTHGLNLKAVFGTPLSAPNVSKAEGGAYLLRMAAAKELFDRKHDLLKTVSAEAGKRIADFWTQAAKTKGALEFADETPRLEGTSLEKLKLIAKSRISGQNMRVNVDYANGMYVVEFLDPKTGEGGEGQIELRRRVPGDKEPVLILHSHDLGKGSGLGKLFYNIANTWVRQLGGKVRADDGGLSAVNTVRRTENGFSFAARNGGESMSIPGFAQRVYGFKENANDKQAAQNLARLALAQRRNVLEAAPEFADIRYDIDTDSFVNADGANADRAVKTMMSRREVRNFSLGRTSFIRAAVTGELMDGDVALPDEIGTPLLYSRKMAEEAEALLRRSVPDILSDAELAGYNESRFDNGGLRPEAKIEKLGWEDRSGMMRRDFYVAGGDGDVGVLRTAWYYPDGSDKKPGAPLLVVEDENGKEIGEYGGASPDVRYSRAKLEKWAEDVAAGRPADPGYVIAESPHIALQMFGVGRSRPVTLKANMVRHLVNKGRMGDGEVTPAMIADIPELLQRPRAVIYRKDGEDYSVIVDRRDEGGNPLLIGIKKDALTMGRNSVDITDVRTMFGKNQSLRYVLQAILDGNPVWMPEKEVARVKDFTDGNQFPNTAKAAVPPRTGESPAPQQSRMGRSAGVSQATTQMVYGDRAVVKFRQGGNDWRLLKEPVNVRLYDVARATEQGLAFSRIDTPEFKRWFGDSKVVDADGRPLVVYHGTRANFSVFDPAKLGSATGAKSATMGFFFADDPRVSQTYAMAAHPLFYSDGSLVKRRSLIVDKAGASVDKVALELAQEIEANGDSEFAKGLREQLRAEVDWVDHLSGGKTGPNIMPVYISLKNPLVYDQLGKGYREQAYAGLLQQAKDEGRDGLIIKNTKDGGDGLNPFVKLARALTRKPVYQDTIYVAFRPEQIKSAIGNRGTFDPDNNDIRFSRRLPSPGETRMSKFRIAVQDYFLPMLETQRAITATGGSVTEDTDVYRAEERMYGRVEEQLRDFRQQWFDPMIEKALKNDITMDELSLYAYAKHAPERNARIAQIRSDMPSNGSGITDAEAAQIMAGFAAAGKTQALEDLHNDLMAITSSTRRVMLDEELISQDEYDAYENQFEFYVPLRGFENARPDGDTAPRRGGKGFNIRGKETMRALGRRTRAGDIIENIVLDYEKAVFRGERNRVGQTFLSLVRANPDPTLWEIDAQRTRASLNRKSGRVNKSVEIDAGKDTVAVKLKGEEVYVKIHDERLLRAMRKASTDETGGLERVLNATLAPFTNMLRASLTQYNPIFAAVNAIRDVQSGSVAVLDELGPKGVKLYAKYYRAALAASGRHQVGSLGKSGWYFGDAAMDRAFQEYRAAGATTGGYYGKSAEEVAQEIRNVLLAAGAAPKGVWENIKTGGGSAPGRLVMRGVQAVGHILEFAGGASENAARVAAYRAAREMGKSPAAAASIAKNLTTNFNRKGEWGQALNTAYLFFNAAMQGAHRTLKALKNRNVQALMAGMTAAGAMSALSAIAVGGDDDDDGQAYWDKIPAFEKERNFIIMLPPGTDMDGVEKVGSNGRYIKIPMPYGFNVFPVLGAQLVDVARHAKDDTRGVSPARGAVNMLNAFMGSYNPLGGAIDLGSGTSIGMALAPTVGDIGIQLAAGVNSFDRPTAPYKSEFDLDPDSENVNARQAGGIWHRIARGMNAMSGGDQDEPGAIDITPGTLENVWRNMTGGTGVFLADTFLNLPTKWFGGEDITARDIPLARNFYGSIDGVTDTSLMYDRRRDILQAKTEAKNRIDRGVDPTKDAGKNALASMAGMAGVYTRRMSALRKQEIALAEDSEISRAERVTRLKEIRLERDQLARDFNAHFMEVMRAKRDGEFNAE